MCLYLFPCVRLSLTRSQGVQEEKELANSGADVERVEGLLQPIQLRQSGDQLQDVVLQILHQITTVNFILAFFFYFFFTISARLQTIIFHLAEKKTLYIT